MMEIMSQPQISDNGDLAAQKALLIRKSFKNGELSEKDRLKAKKVAQDFEALFTGIMMKSMRESVQQKNSLISGGRGEEIYRSLLDQEYANATAKSGSLGLAKIIEKEIIRHETGGKPVIDIRK